MDAAEERGKQMVGNEKRPTHARTLAKKETTITTPAVVRQGSGREKEQRKGQEKRPEQRH